jgi:bacterioferritin (cytochrome b1)
MNACILKETAMNENNKLLNVLYILLTDELSDINHYIAPSESFTEMDSGKLHLAVRKQAGDKMKNVEWLIRRIIFYEGSLMGFDLNEIRIYEMISEMIREVKGEQLYASVAYMDAFKRAAEIDDRNAAELLTRMLQMTKGQEDWSGFALIN